MNACPAKSRRSSPRHRGFYASDPRIRPVLLEPAQRRNGKNQDENGEAAKARFCQGEIISRSAKHFQKIQKKPPNQVDNRVSALVRFEALRSRGRMDTRGRRAYTIGWLIQPREWHDEGNFWLINTRALKIAVDCGCAYESGIMPLSRKTRNASAD